MVESQESNYFQTVITLLFQLKKPKADNQATHTPPNPSSLEDGPMRESSAKTSHLWNMSTLRQSRPRSSSHSLPEDTKRDHSKRWTAQLLKDWKTLWWWKAETTGKSNLPWELWSKPWRSFTLSLELTLSKSWLMLLLMEELEKIPPESEAVVWSEDKLWTSLHWEELTKQSTWWQEDLEKPPSELSRVSLSV